MLVYAGISLLCCVAALVAWRLAKRGKRVDAHPICKKCGYDLVGQDVYELPACPECGAQVAPWQNLRFGNRRPRKITALCALGLALIALIFAGGFTTHWARSYDWNRVKPVSMLIKEASDPTNLNQMDAALKEIERREQEGRLSQSQRESLIHAALTYQKDKTKVWDTRWGEMISRARLDGACDRADWELYLVQAADFELQVRERIQEGGPFVLSGEFITPFRGDASISGIDYYTEDALHVVRRLIMGKAIDPPIIQFRDSYGFGRRYFRDLHNTGFEKLPPGQYELTVSATLRGHEPVNNPARYLLFPEVERFEVRTIDLSTQFEVFPKSVPLINAVHDPAIAQQAKNYMLSSLNHFLYQDPYIDYNEYSGRFYVEYGIPSSDIPYPCSYDVLVFVEGEQVEFVETVVLYPVTTGTHSYFMTNFGLPRSIQDSHDPSNPPTIDKFTLRLVPNPEHLKQELDGYDYLDHVIVIEDIPVAPYRP